MVQGDDDEGGDQLDPASPMVFQVAMLSFMRTISQFEDPRAIMWAAVEMVGRTLRANRSGYSEVTDDGAFMTFQVSWSDGVLAPLTGSIPTPTAGNAALSVLGEGRTLVFERGDPDDPRTPPAWRNMGARASISVPLLREGRYCASLWVHQAVDRTWTPAEIGLIEDVAARTWDAVKRARAEEALKRLNATLLAQVEERTRQLRESEAQWRSLFAQMQEALILCQVIRDAGGTIIDWRFAEMNPAWEALFGASRRDYLGMAATKANLAQAQAEGWIDGARRIVDGRETMRFERGVERTGRRYQAEAFRVDDERFAILFLDTTIREATEARLRLSEDQLKQESAQLAILNQTLEQRVGERTAELEATQDALRQAQKMEAIGQLTGGIAHDFNNLLAGISGSLELMSTRIAAGRAAEIGRYIETAQGAARRAAALTHRLLAFSRRQTLSPVVADVGALCGGMEDLLRRSIGPSIEMSVEAAPDAWPIMIDDHQLENALLNLVINARDAMPSGGRLAIGIANRHLGDGEAEKLDVAAGDYVVLSIADTGTGMTPDVIARAVDPFFTTKPTGQGTGLGLSMVYGFVRQSGGQLTITSAPEVGTTVELHLPRHHGPNRATAPVERRPTRSLKGEGRAVLVVDDEPSVLLLITDVLRGAGYATMEAVDGASAMRIIDSGVPIDLLISDVGLPGGLNGRQLADAALALRPDMKILLVTGYAEASTFDPPGRGSSIEILTKPFSVEALTTRVRAVMAAGAV